MMAGSTHIAALLPIKANSNRVKGKNFREFCGKPLFRWILDTLLSVNEIDQIIINTDARDVLTANGLEESDRITLRDRKAEIRGDEVSMNRVLADDVQNVDADMYLMTHVTNPLLSGETICSALREYKDARQDGLADSLMTVNKVQTRFYRKDASPLNHDPANLVPTQDLEPWYEENSNLYLFDKKSFTATSARIGEKPLMHEMGRLESVDIDTPEDWDFAVAAASMITGRDG